MEKWLKGCCCCNSMQKVSFNSADVVPVKVTSISDRSDDIRRLFCTTYQIKLIFGSRSKLIYGVKVQSALGLATMGIAANLGITTATSLTDLCHYIIATLGITTFNLITYVAKKRPSTPRRLLYPAEGSLYWF